MLTLPLPFILSWFFGLLSLAVLGASGYVLWEWHVGQAIAVVWIASSVIGALWTIAGRFVVLAFFPKGEHEPRSVRRGKQAKLTMRDGTRIHTETEGPPDAP